jgi:hypothetical protein
VLANSAALLVRAGAKLDRQWYEHDEDRRRAAEKLRSDLRMLAALRGGSRESRQEIGREQTATDRPSNCFPGIEQGAGLRIQALPPILGRSKRMNPSNLNTY